jgi:hypothetical protein
MSMPRFRRDFTFRPIAVAAFVLIASATPNAAGLRSIPTWSDFVTIETNTLGPSTHIAGSSGVWVLHAPTLSVDCSPPRGCYATTQRVYYSFNCSPRYIVVAERISMDLNGTIVKHELQETVTYSPVDDEIATWVLDCVCPLSQRDLHP